MQVLFVIDPIASLKAYKDSSVAMMYAFAAKGHEIFITEQQDLYIKGQVWARTQAIQVIEQANLEEHAWWQEVGSVQERNLADFDAVIMRKDPPFDMEYAYSCHLLAYAEKFGAKVFNSGVAMLNHPEKLTITEFSQFTSPTLVTRDMARVKAFHQEHEDIVVKPLDGMGGMGIFRLQKKEPNLSSILEMLSRNGQETIMAQRYIPDIVKGDKRILIINGKPVPYCLARIPLAGETRGNLAAGGRGVAQPLSERDWEIANTLAPILKERGLFLVGLDVIGDYLTEVNVTSPTCFVEITQQTDFHVANFFVEQLESVLGA
ncbi:glutathione synthase [Pelistega suis]|uniref:Glutathione synthetase n=1 Tax=Pelistega suis TaxID=1631957 RepID=A0A849P9Q1_9BURK|nr:glutathione synthase [Pelistega suis]NOL52452.1 glutathione synthase [Pelistega suis]